MRDPGTTSQRSRALPGLLLAVVLLASACSRVEVAEETPTTTAAPARPGSRVAGEPTDDRARAAVDPSAVPVPAVLHVVGAFDVLDEDATISPPDVLASDRASIGTLACVPDAEGCALTALDRLTEHGLEVANVATGELGAADSDALTATVNQLRTDGVEVVGWGENIESAVTPVRLDHPFHPVAVFGISLADDELEQTAHATETDPGIAGPDSFTALLGSMGGSVEAGDRIVVFVDWGEPDRRAPDAETVELASALLRAGASAVVGTGSEFLNRLEVLEGAPVVFDLGQAATATEDALRRDTAVLRLVFDAAGTDFCLLPATSDVAGVTLDGDAADCDQP